ncbi:expressed unknown protein [Seminavis robusta]|uniref:Uncharacterized protein n=1 Tax=Seminavis robusta TaxID=568900 RepID=A0A9N8DL39_9STRA|nr:expressed unknown protein [Seminavis robusta]|eukprot:Sro215_g088900.1 n/a (1253) ;mRNA; f:2971-7053
MDRILAMVLLLFLVLVVLLMFGAFFAVAPVICTCLISLLYSLYLFMAYEQSGVHQAQEYENRFWTIFGLLLSTALFFAKDSPFAFGRHWSPSLGFTMVILSGYIMHVWDRHHHRNQISQQTRLRRASIGCISLNTLNQYGLRVEDQLARINGCLRDIDQLLIPSTINNFINLRFVLQKEREIISIFEECDARALNYLVGHVKLALLFYKIKDHRNFAGQNRTRIIQLLAVERLAILTVMSRVIVLHSLQLLKLKANPRAEQWVLNIIQNTNQDDLSQLKTLMDGKGDYFCMTKLVYEDLRSESTRQDILSHIRREAAVQQAHMQMGTKRAQKRKHLAWRKVLSDVDDTLLSSGGSYPSGVDKRYAKKVVYPGVLAFYRELDLGTQGPDEWPENRLGNLVFLSARPHVYKDMSEKANFKKFEKMRLPNQDGRKGMHTVPSLLAGDIASGSKFMASGDFEHLAVKKFENFKRYVSIYPEFKHVFVADNGQGDVRAGEMMFDNFPYELEALYVHEVTERRKTHGYDAEAYRKKEFFPCFFTTYPEAAIHAATIADPPLMGLKGMRRVCADAAGDFQAIAENKWATIRTKAERRLELNQAIWLANSILERNGLEPVPLIQAEEIWAIGQIVKTPYGLGTICSFNPETNLYEVDLDWRPLNVQLADHLTKERNETILPRNSTESAAGGNNDSTTKLTLETVVEIEEIEEGDAVILDQGKPDSAEGITVTPSVSGRRPSSEQLSRILAKLPREESDNNNDGTATKAEGENFAKTVKTSAKMGTPPAARKVKAYVAGHQITKYTPPVLPKLDKTRGSIFTFWSPSNSSAEKKSIYKAGAHCTTPYGNATIVEHREKHRLVVVDMIGWKAKAFLREDDVKIASKGLIRSLFRKMSGSEAPPVKPKDFPYAEGTIINTPYGKGSVTKPLPFKKGTEGRETPRRNSSKKGEAAFATPEHTTRRSRSGSIGSPNAEAQSVPTIGISLTSWKLANGTHPVIYCPVATAQEWKDRRHGGILSKTVNLVSKSKTLLGSLLTPSSRASNKQKKETKEDLTPLEKQYYQDSAKVSTQFGKGIITSFRPKDGFYCISLCNWSLANGSHPVAYLKKNDIKTQIAEGCQEGYPVYTKLGLTGTLQSVQPTTGVHIVTVGSAGIVCYLQPEFVLRPIKAAVGEDVLTAYGEGVVEKYRVKDDTYQIELKGWHGAKLYAKAETFDRVDDGMQDRGSFGMKWLLDMFFSSDSRGGTVSRSRSNSITSGRTSRTS